MLQKVTFYHFYPTDWVNTKTTTLLRVGEQHQIQYIPRRFTSRYISTTIHLPFGGQLYIIHINIATFKWHCEVIKSTVKEAIVTCSIKQPQCVWLATNHDSYGIVIKHLKDKHRLNLPYAPTADEMGRLLCLEKSVTFFAKEEATIKF